MIQFARSLDLAVIAKGIESEELLKELRQSGCAMGQGYLLGRPMPAEVISANLAGGQAA